MAKEAVAHVCITLQDIQAVAQFLQSKASDVEKQKKLDGLYERAQGCPDCVELLRDHFEM